MILEQENKIYDKYFYKIKLYSLEKIRLEGDNINF